MSNDQVRVTFKDGTVLYGIGDTTELVSRRLYRTKEEAWAAYSSDDIYAPILINMVACDGGAEPVHLETTYGTLDHSWHPMATQYARANKAAQMVTRAPSYEDPERPYDGP